MSARRPSFLVALFLPAFLGAGLPATAAPQPETALEPPCAAANPVNDSCPLWVSTYDNGNNPSPGLASSAGDEVTATLLSSDEQRFFVTGRSWDPARNAYGYAVTALSNAGSTLWTQRFDHGLDAGGRAFDYTRPASLAESPDGGTLYVTGTVPKPSDTDDQDILTFGLNAATGAITWTWRWSPGGSAEATEVAVSPDGSTVYVAGTSEEGFPRRADYEVAAYSFDEELEDPVLWTRSAGFFESDGLMDMALSSDGSKLFLTGSSKPASLSAAATLAIDTESGAALWSKSTHGAAGSGYTTGYALAVSPDDSRVFVTAHVRLVEPPILPAQSLYGTVAYDSATGQELWLKEYKAPGPRVGDNLPADITVDDRGELVFVTGASSLEASEDSDIATIAYRAGTGEQVWESRYGLPGQTREGGTALAYEPDQDRLYVTGSSGSTQYRANVEVSFGRFFTLAIDAGNGERVAALRYGGTDKGTEPQRALDLDNANSIAVGQGSRKLFVAGTFGAAIPGTSVLRGYDFGVLGYNLPGSGMAKPTAGGWASQNIEYVGHVPNSTDSAGLKILGNWAYVTTESTLKIYDITDPLNPKLTGVAANPGDDLPYFPEEDVDTNGKILLMGADVFDVSDKANPKSIATLTALNDHTVTCVLDCTWAYTSGGRIIDLRTPTAPVQRAMWTTGMPATGNRHDVTEVAPGLIVTSSNPFLLLDARDNPAAPKLIARGPSEATSHYTHGNLGPNQATDKYLLMGGERGGPNCADNASSVLRTFDVRNWAQTGEISLVDKYTAPKGLYTEGRSPEDTYCAHWFTTHPTYRNGGLVAMGWYEHGMRLLRLNGAGKIREVGYFIPHGGTTSAAYWVNDSIIYLVDYNRGLEILRYTGRA